MLTLTSSVHLCVKNLQSSLFLSMPLSAVLVGRSSKGSHYKQGIVLLMICIVSRRQPQLHYTWPRAVLNSDRGTFCGTASSRQQEEWWTSANLYLGTSTRVLLHFQHKKLLNYHTDLLAIAYHPLQLLKDYYYLQNNECIPPSRNINIHILLRCHRKSLPTSADGKFGLTFLLQRQSHY